MDLIERQAAIDALDKHCDVICQYSKKQRSVMCGACSLGTAFDVIENLPSAQPYTEADIQKMQDLEQAELQKAYELGRASAQPEWDNHTVACLLAELFGDTCACNYNGIDEWLPEKCEVIDACPNPVGVACWEQFLKHRAERRTDEQ